MNILCALKNAFFIKVNLIARAITLAIDASFYEVGAVLSPTNEQAERFVQILKNFLRRMRSNPSNVQGINATHQ